MCRIVISLLKILMNVIRHQHTHFVIELLRSKTFLYFNERVWAAVSKDTCSNIRKLGLFEFFLSKIECVTFVTEIGEN